MGSTETAFLSVDEQMELLTRGAADQTREVSDQKDDVVPQFLKLPHLVDQHRVSDVKIGCRGIKTGFDPEGCAALQFFSEILLHEDLRSATADFSELIFQGDGHNL